VITASKTRYAQLLEIIKTLDIRPSQVLIQAALIEITGSLNEILGVELAAVDVNATKKTPFGISSFNITDLVDTDGDGFPDSRSLRNPLATGLTGGIFDPKDFALPFVLQAVATQNDSNILSLPSILTNDNESAMVTAEDAVPYTQTNQGQNSDSTSLGGTQKAASRSTSRRPSAPAATCASTSTSRCRPSSGRRPTRPLPPPSLERNIKTSVTIPDGHTMVFGGVITDDQTRREDKIPILGDIPLIGFLFRNSNNTNKKTNLYFFLTPHIIADDFATLDELTEKHKLEAKKLGGKVEMLNRFFESDNKEAEKVTEALLERYFELPAYASVADRPAPPSDPSTRSSVPPER
jgi:general secretion pathway protein D